MAYFRKILWCQLIWFIAASLFNWLSYISVKNGNLGWAGAGPERAQFLVLVIGCVTSIGFIGVLRLYKFAAPIVVSILLIGGVIRHILADHSTYFSSTTLLAAILINIFGVYAFIMGTKIAWSSSNCQPK